MKTAFSPVRSSSRRGFTLIELLVVIAIIAVLVAGACGAFYFAIDKARFLDAQSMARTVAAAVDDFQKEYDAMPLPASATADTDCESDTSAAEGLMLILTGADKTQNPRGINFLTNLKDARGCGKNRRVNGIIRDGGNVELVDPYGLPYKVTLDLDGDGLVRNPDAGDATAGRKELHKTVIIYSAGKDRDFSTWSDNPASWRSR